MKRVVPSVRIELTTSGYSRIETKSLESRISINIFP